MLELFELRVYPKPEDAYEDDGVFITVADRVTLNEADEILGDYKQYPRKNTSAILVVGNFVIDAETVAVSHTDGKRYFAPRDGFGWMETNETNNL